MARLIDMAGVRYGRLVVIERDREKQVTHNLKWRCLCDCGREVTVLGTSLRNGATKSCGCLRRDVGADRASAMRAAMQNSGARFHRTQSALESVFGKPESERTEGAVRIVRGRRY